MKLRLHFRRRGPRLVERLGYSFTDMVSGERVYRWRAADGSEWLANRRGRGTKVPCAGQDPTIGFVEQLIGDVP